MSTPQAKPDDAVFYRHYEVLDFERHVRAADEGQPEDEYFLVTLSSEAPHKQPWGSETLSHEASAIDMSIAKHGLPFLAEHGGPPPFSTVHVDPEMLAGTISDIELVGRKLKGKLRFNRSRAQGVAIRQEFLDGHRKFVSVGWVPTKAPKLLSKAGEPPEYLFTRWKPIEVSAVLFPADYNAVFGRSAGATHAAPYEPEPSEEPSMPEPTITPTIDPQAGGQPAAGEPAAGAGDRQVRSAALSRAEVLRALNPDAEAIESVCKLAGHEDKASQFITQGLELRQVKSALFEIEKTKALSQPPTDTGLGLSPKEAARYSYSRAVRSFIERKGEPDGFEGEIHRHIRSNLLPQGYKDQGGLLLPMRLGVVDDRYEQSRQVRAMGTGVGGGGAETIFTQQGELIDIVRARLWLAALGVEFLSGVTAPIEFPKLVRDLLWYWMGENPANGVTESELGWGTVELNLKTAMGAGTLPRQLIQQSSVDQEGRVKESLGASLARFIEYYGVHGYGVGKEPTGIYAAPGVQVQAMGGVPTHAKLVEMQGLAADKNFDDGTFAYLTTPLMAAKLKTVLEASAAGSKMLWVGPIRDGVLAENRAVSTTNVSKVMSTNDRTGGSSHALVYGPWSTMTVGLGPAMELVIDPYTAARKAQILYTGYQTVDVVMRYPEAFVKATGATIS